MPAPLPAPRQPIPFAIQWLTDRLHVGTSDREVIGEFRRRMTGSDDAKALYAGPAGREARRQVYADALAAHRANLDLYTFVTGSI